jgi:hypothetical protein
MHSEQQPTGGGDDVPLASAIHIGVVFDGAYLYPESNGQ